MDGRGILRRSLEIKTSDIDLEDHFLAQTHSVQFQSLALDDNRVGHLDPRHLPGQNHSRESGTGQQ